MWLRLCAQRAEKLAQDMDFLNACSAGKVDQVRTTMSPASQPCCILWRTVCARAAKVLGLNGPAQVSAALKTGQSPDTADYDTRTGLMLACHAGHLSVAKLLLQGGAQPNIKDFAG